MGSNACSQKSVVTPGNSQNYEKKDSVQGDFSVAADRAIKQLNRGGKMHVKEQKQSDKAQKQIRDVVEKKESAANDQSLAGENKKKSNMH